MVLARRLEGGFDKVRLGQVEVDCSRRVDKESIKCLACPLLPSTQPQYPGTSGKLTWMVCSMAFGKFLTVQEGIDFSGGSCEDEYDSVRNGTTTWVLALVPSVPDSSRGF
jgi:hypothetical protein